MPKKGKKAKAPLSDEEQLLLFQQKLLADEETAKKKERLLNQFLKDKLAKEEHNSALNLNKINTQWRMVLREVKTRELHKDIEILSQTFERVVDCKDSVIKGEKILKLAEICRKFETEEEKVLPFYASALTPKEQAEVEALNQEELTEDLAQVMVNYTGMENFWKRYNKVKLEVLSLQHRRAQLLDISGKLKEMLKQYLDGISVSDEVLSQPNPLFIVNHRSNLAQPLSMPAAQSGDK
uniref:dynein regulatory complex subunit 2 isoform X4 n=1 Tax=Jaculus jaculus TaxID=51337 RepID=UPI001E1B2344|nr:dynein regulatory complex subunit 2 isoform X4 [Jaculus jaculus]